MHSTATASCSRRAPQSCTKSLSKSARTSPDILLVSGDLTKDGEQECHAALAKQLQQLQQDVPGLKIYVINGNHDIRNYNAKNFNTPRR